MAQLDQRATEGTRVPWGFADRPAYQETLPMSFLSLVNEASLEREEKRESQEALENLVKEVFLVSRVSKDSLGLLAPKASQDLKERMEEPEIQVHQDCLDLRVSVDFQAMWEFPGALDHLVFLDQEEKRERLAKMDPLVPLVFLDHQGCRERQDHQGKAKTDRGVSLEHRDHKDLQG